MPTGAAFQHPFTAFHRPSAIVSPPLTVVPPALQPPPDPTARGGSRRAPVGASGRVFEAFHFVWLAEVSAESRCCSARKACLSLMCCCVSLQAAAAAAAGQTLHQI